MSRFIFIALQVTQAYMSLMDSRTDMDSHFRPLITLENLKC